MYLDVEFLPKRCVCCEPRCTEKGLGTGSFQADWGTMRRRGCGRSCSWQRLQSWTPMEMPQHLDGVQRPNVELQHNVSPLHVVLNKQQFRLLRHLWYHYWISKSKEIKELQPKKKMVSGRGHNSMLSLAQELIICHTWCNWVLVRWVEEDFEPSSAIVERTMDVIGNGKLQWQSHQERNEETQDDCSVDQTVDSEASNPVAHDNKEEPETRTELINQMLAKLKTQDYSLG